MTRTIRHAALQLNLPADEPIGLPRWGGHALRRGGAQYFGVAGVEVWRIQALARHSGAAILTYLAAPHIPSIASMALEAALHRDLSTHRGEVSSMRVRLLAAHTAPNGYGAPHPARHLAQTPTRACLLHCRASREPCRNAVFYGQHQCYMCRVKISNVY